MKQMEVNIWSRLLVKVRLARFTKDEDGAMAVEFALVLPIYLMVITMIIEFSLLTYAQAVVFYSAEQATRFAVVNFNATVEDIQLEARANLLGVDTSNLTAIVVTAPTDVSDNTKLVSVTVQYKYTPILPISKLFNLDNDGTINLAGNSSGFITDEVEAAFAEEG